MKNGSFLKQLRFDLENWSAGTNCNGLCAVIDSQQHVNSCGGGMIIMANDPKKAIIEYANCLLKYQNLTLDLGTLNWVKYTME